MRPISKIVTLFILPLSLILLAGCDAILDPIQCSINPKPPVIKLRNGDPIEIDYPYAKEVVDLIRFYDETFDPGDAKATYTDKEWQEFVEIDYACKSLSTRLIEVNARNFDATKEDQEITFSLNYEGTETVTFPVSVKDDVAPYVHFTNPYYEYKGNANEVQLVEVEASQLSGSEEEKASQVKEILIRNVFNIIVDNKDGIYYAALANDNVQRDQTLLDTMVEFELGADFFDHRTYSKQPFKEVSFKISDSAGNVRDGILYVKIVDKEAPQLRPKADVVKIYAVSLEHLANFDFLSLVTMTDDTLQESEIRKLIKFEMTDLKKSVDPSAKTVSLKATKDGIDVMNTFKNGLDYENKYTFTLTVQEHDEQEPTIQEVIFQLTNNPNEARITPEIKKGEDGKPGQEVVVTYRRDKSLKDQIEAAIPGIVIDSFPQNYTVVGLTNEPVVIRFNYSTYGCLATEKYHACDLTPADEEAIISYSVVDDEAPVVNWKKSYEDKKIFKIGVQELQQLSESELIKKIIEEMMLSISENYVVEYYYHAEEGIFDPALLTDSHLIDFPFELVGGVYSKVTAGDYDFKLELTDKTNPVRVPITIRIEDDIPPKLNFTETGITIILEDFESGSYSFTIKNYETYLKVNALSNLTGIPADDIMDNINVVKADGTFSGRDAKTEYGVTEQEILDEIERRGRKLNEKFYLPANENGTVLISHFKKALFLFNDTEDVSWDISSPNAEMNWTLDHGNLTLTVGLWELSSDKKEDPDGPDKITITIIDRVAPQAPMRQQSKFIPSTVDYKNPENNYYFFNTYDATLRYGDPLLYFDKATFSDLGSDEQCKISGSECRIVIDNQIDTKTGIGAVFIDVIDSHNNSTRYEYHFGKTINQDTFFGEPIATTNKTRIFHAGSLAASEGQLVNKYQSSLSSTTLTITNMNIPTITKKENGIVRKVKNEVRFTGVRDYEIISRHGDIYILYRTTTNGLKLKKIRSINSNLDLSNALVEDVQLTHNGKPYDGFDAKDFKFHKTRFSSGDEIFVLAKYTGTTSRDNGGIDTMYATTVTINGVLRSESGTKDWDDDRDEWYLIYGSSYMETKVVGNELIFYTNPLYGSGKNEGHGLEQGSFIISSTGAISYNYKARGKYDNSGDFVDGFFPSNSNDTGIVVIRYSNSKFEIATTHGNKITNTPTLTSQPSFGTAISIDSTRILLEVKFNKMSHLYLLHEVAGKQATMDKIESFNDITELVLMDGNVLMVNEGGTIHYLHFTK